MKWQEPKKNLFFWKNTSSAENKSALFENVLSNDSILKISVHTNDIDSGDTLSELDFRPSSKYWSHHWAKNRHTPISNNIFFRSNHLTLPSKILLSLFYNVCGIPLAISCFYLLYIACCLQFVESSFWCFYIPCSLYHVEFFSCCYFNACD